MAGLHQQSYLKQTNAKLNNYPSLQSLTPHTTHLINHTTTNSTMEHLIEQVVQTQLFTIATEIDCLTNKPALIQIECVGRPSTIILIECWHLPERHAHLFNQISRLFLSIFEPTKEIQSWGDLSIALKPFVRFNLFSMSNIQDIHFSDVQQMFQEWYNGIFPHAEGCGPSAISILDNDSIYLHPTDSDRNLSSITEQYDYLSCSCSHRPYKNPNDNWSLHAAVKTTFQEFLDDTPTSSPWGLGLGFILDVFIPKHLVGKQRSTEIAKEKEYRRYLVEYATLICLSITKLSVGIRRRWSRQDLERYIQSTHVQAKPPAISNTEFSSSQSSTNDTNIDDKSHSDGYTIDTAVSASIVSPLPNERLEAPKEQMLSMKEAKQQPSESVRRHRQKRRAAQRVRRKATRIICLLHDEFKIEQVEQILDELQISRRYCNIRGSRVLHIVCNSPTDKIRYNDLLGDQYFTKSHYDQVFGSRSLSSQMDHLLPEAC